MNLKEEVLAIIEEQGGIDEQKTFMEDVMEYGCISGTVGQLIYYTDTVAFYDRHSVEIGDMLTDLMDDMGIYEPSELFNNWEENDDSILEFEDKINQNTLAWFGFEEMTREIYEEMYGAY